MFKIVGGLLAAYVAFAVARGEVYAKSGAWGRTVKRTESATYFWAVIAIYGALSLALLIVF